MFAIDDILSAGWRHRLLPLYSAWILNSVPDVFSGFLFSVEMILSDSDGKKTSFSILASFIFVLSRFNNAYPLPDGPFSCLACSAGEDTLCMIRNLGFGSVFILWGTKLKKFPILSNTP